MWVTRSCLCTVYGTGTCGFNTQMCEGKGFVGYRRSSSASVDWCGTNPYASSCGWSACVDEQHLKRGRRATCLHTLHRILRRLLTTFRRMLIGSRLVHSASWVHGW